MYGFEAVIRLSEGDRQPIKQSRMARAPSIETKVIGRFHDPSAKVIMPKTIYHYPGK